MIAKASKRCAITRIEIIYYSIWEPKLLKVGIQFFFIDFKSLREFAQESKDSYDQNVFHIYYY